MINFPCASPPSTCDQQPNPKTSYSAEQVDSPIFIGLASTSIPPLLNKSFNVFPCVAIEESQVSQEDADLAAQRAAVICANPCSTIFTNTQQTDQAPCVNGAIYFFTIASGLYAATDQISADRSAFTAAVDKLTPLCLTALSQTDICKGSSYNGVILAIAPSGQTVGFSVIMGALPDGITIEVAGNEAVFSGIPTVFGTFEFTIEARSSTGVYTRQSYTMHVAGITTLAGVLDDGFSGTPYSSTITGVPVDGIPTVWTVSSGALPPGLSLNSGTGTISGNPTTSGTYDFVIAANMGELVCSRQYSIKVQAINWGLLDWTLIKNVVGGGVGGLGNGIYNGASFSVAAKGDSSPTGSTQALGTLMYTGPSVNCQVTVTVTASGTSSMGFIIRQDGVQKLLSNLNATAPGVYVIPFVIAATVGSVITVVGLTDIGDPARLFVQSSGSVLGAYSGTLANS